jgi:RND family efflux transporter MFP subunit
VALLSACNETPKPAGFPPAVVQVTPVAVRPFCEKTDYLGTLRSRKSVTLSPNVEGQVAQIFVTSGQSVHAGDKLLQIDARMQSAQKESFEAAALSVNSDLANAKATLASLESSLNSKVSTVEFSNAQYARYQTLADQGAVALADRDSWKNRSEAAESERQVVLRQIEAQRMTVQKFERTYRQALDSLQAQKEQLKYYSITAPFAGIVGDIPVKVGNHVSSSTTLTTVTENHPLEVYISIPAEKVSAMTLGMSVALLSTDGDNFGTSKVTFIAPTVDPASQTVLVKTLYANDKNLLRADQTARAQIIWKQREGIAVPTTAVMQVAGKRYVFVAEKDKDGKEHARQAEIEIYGIEGTHYQVKSGLKLGDRLITTGIQRLTDGAPIAEKASAVLTDQRGKKLIGAR